MEKTTAKQTVYTLLARCRDCYRCLKVCPVKAIRMKDGQAYVDETRCIVCGTCIRECPQHAKTYVSTLHDAKRILQENKRVAASLAPSFAAFFPGWRAARVASALRCLGFEIVAETAQAAEAVANASVEAAQASGYGEVICTACPAVVNYVEKYRPSLAPALLPILSPMVAHAKWLKSGDRAADKVIFIGPCVAKKYEATRSEYDGIVDCVLTFDELIQWFEEEKIDLKNCEDGGSEEQMAGFSRLYPLPGGMFRTAGIEAPAGDMKHFHLSGASGVLQLLDAKCMDAVLIDPLFCEGGCINGPGGVAGGNVFERRKELIAYSSVGKEAPINQKIKISTSRDKFSSNKAVMLPSFQEEEIRTVLEKTGKTTPEDMLNCGACGYKDCREKAVAVLEGMAELEMCLPFMRRLAEQRTDRIIETSPNGIVVLDDKLLIIKMNPAFRKFFKVTDATLGSHISTLMDPVGFEKLASGSAENIDVTETDPSTGYSFHELFYALRQYGQYVGIFIDITVLKRNREKLEAIRLRTAGQAKEMLDEQIKMTQQIAWQLGENMARTEELVRKLTDLHGEGSQHAANNKR